MSEGTRFLAPGPLPFIRPDFQVVEWIGRVGDGIVYTARDGLAPARLREYCPHGVTLRGGSGALLPREERFAAAWAEGVRRFVEQGHALAALDHPGVNRIWGAVAVESSGLPPMGGYLIGEPVGEPLAAAFAAGLVLSPADVIRFARELAGALAAVHGRGLTHLDIAPETVSVAAGRVQLTDFGVDNRLFMPLLGSQEGLVRPGYSPLEHYEGPAPEPLGPRADIYAACALVFRLITGAPPAPATARFRDPTASQLAPRDAYPPAFVDAIRRGLAVEPDDRFADGTDWLAALSIETLDAPSVIVSPPIDLAKPEPAPPVVITPVPTPISPQPTGPFGPPSDPQPAAKRRKGGCLIPAIILGLLVLAAAAAALYAYQQGWIFPPAVEGDEPTANRAARPRTTPATPKSPDAVPTLRVGGTLSGRLTRDDQRAQGGQYRDRFTINGRRGERAELRLSSNEFDPLLTVTGNGLNLSNDDDLEAGTLNSRLIVTFPRDGAYTITVSSFPADQTGDYVLEALAGEAVAAAPVGAGTLAGRWRQASDTDCSDPATIAVSGRTITYARQGVTFREQVLGDADGVVRVRVDGGPSDGLEFDFRIRPDGASFVGEDGIWLRC